MITIALSYRNRDLSIVKNCLESLEIQTNKQFRVILVNYGSFKNYTEGLNTLVEKFKFVKVINCLTEKQLWCKSRAINIALKKCETPYFFVGDVDMIYHPRFIEFLLHLKEEYDTVYFQVGFLSSIESKKNKDFFNYVIDFKSAKEATGMTLYQTQILKSINGYDEFYNGWGSEDTDVHVRLQNANKEVFYFNTDILMLHQWHAKGYRSKDSKAPFHPNLEAINQKYLEFTKETQKTIANTKFNWGEYNDQDYIQLENIDRSFSITNELPCIKGFVNSTLLELKDLIVFVSVKKHDDYKSYKQKAKKVLRKKAKVYLTMQEINNLLLEVIITNLRTCPYKLMFNKDLQEITLIIKL